MKTDVDLEVQELNRRYVYDKYDIYNINSIKLN